MRAVALYTLFVQGCAELEQCNELAQLAMISSTSIIASLISFTGVAAELSQQSCLTVCVSHHVSHSCAFQIKSARFSALGAEIWEIADGRKVAFLVVKGP